MRPGFDSRQVHSIFLRIGFLGFRQPEGPPGWLSFFMPMTDHSHQYFIHLTVRALNNTDAHTDGEALDVLIDQYASLLQRYLQLKSETTIIIGLNQDGLPLCLMIVRGY